MDYDNPDNKQELNEPPASYGAMHGMKLSVFKSWEEAEEAAAKAISLQSPVERIRETVALILRVYGVTQEELNNRRKKLHIKILRYE
jgi:hypothetical protein